MPLDDNLRLQILSINCPTQRLRRELEIVRKVVNTVKVITGLHTENSPDRRNTIEGEGGGEEASEAGVVGMIETIHAINERENIMDARAHPVSSCLNSPALFSFKLRPLRLVLSGRLRSPQTRIASG